MVSSLACTRQSLAVALPGDDRVHNCQTADAGDVAEHAMDLDIHLIQGLLHVLNVLAGELHQCLPVAQHRAKGADLLFRTEGALQQPDRVKVLQPRRMAHVALSAGHVFVVAGVNQIDLDAALLQHLIQGDPVNPGGFHGHGSDATFPQPIGDAAQFPGKGAESADGHVVAWVHSHVNDFRTDIDAGHVRAHLGWFGDGLQSGLLSAHVDSPCSARVAPAWKKRVVS
jgi:hypothetical protein